MHMCVCMHVCVNMIMHLCVRVFVGSCESNAATEGIYAQLSVRVKAHLKLICTTTTMAVMLTLFPFVPASQQPQLTTFLLA